MAPDPDLGFQVIVINASFSYFHAACAQRLGAGQEKENEEG
ncbi:hypothetical protein RBY4I_2945 [Rhodobacterales bacterium Y4I]|nr:hypothetical protein RBY4I_2945 [Rhodobacterales bacterium Y4I]